MSRRKKKPFPGKDAHVLVDYFEEFKKTHPDTFYGIDREGPETRLTGIDAKSITNEDMQAALIALAKRFGYFR